MRCKPTVSILVAIGGTASAAFVTIGNTANSSDTNGYGAVNYPYQISTHEVTGGEFQEAAALDPNIGESISNSDSSPAAYVSWNEAAKYCNWLTTGDAHAGAYEFDETGTLTNELTRAQILADGRLFYLLPTENEWYKAAYFTTNGTYSLYANGTDTAPDALSARYSNTTTWAVGSGAIEINGTYDMMGNIYEWTETRVGTNRVLRGGYYGSTSNEISSPFRIHREQTAEEPGGGFRIAVIHEPITPGRVRTTDFYDNRRCPVMWTGGDLYQWDWSWPFLWDAAEAARSNQMVFTPAIVIGAMTTSNWQVIQSAINDGYVMPANHSWSHPASNVNYELEYTISQQTLFDNLTFPWQKTYNGQEYDPFFVQFGIASDIDLDIIHELSNSNNILAIQHYTRIEPTPLPTWNSEANVFEHEDKWIKYTVGINEILNGSYSSHFDTAYSKGFLYFIATQPWMDADQVNGTNSAIWAEFFSYVGNRKDVWYTDPASLLSYHYLEDQHPPEITVSNTSGQMIITVTGDHAERVKYGLSYPLTYEIIKPSDWVSTSGVSVYYRDSTAPDWTLIEQKTTNDFFTGINAYRDAGNTVYVSQGLPQTTDSFDLRVIPGNYEGEEGRDWGDAWDVPGGPGFQTLYSNNGASHVITNLYMGTTVDTETDGQPNAAATGDDDTPASESNDEDGITFLTPFIHGQPAQMHVTVSPNPVSNGWLAVWIDDNNNGQWDHPLEMKYSSAVTAGVNTISFTVPGTTPTGTNYLRFRLTSGMNSYPAATGPVPNGPAFDGEVEDYRIEVVEQADWGDAPDSPYPTVALSRGAFHVIVSNFYLGRSIDSDTNGMPTVEATGDDLADENDDEDGLISITSLAKGLPAIMEVEASASGILEAWLDANSDGTWTHAGERICSTNVSAGTNTIYFTVPSEPSVTRTNRTFLRLRFSSAGGLTPAGGALDGEVEDHKVEIKEVILDWGDAPGNLYPTMASASGAAHLIVTNSPNSGPVLGRIVDSEADGQPNADATGDDSTGTFNDEDGITFAPNITSGTNGSVTVVVTNTPGILNAWIDFNGDGDWADTNERIITDAVMSIGSTNLSFAVPLPSVVGDTFARFRISSAGGLSYDNSGLGYIPDGEVEDCILELHQPVPTNAITITNLHLDINASNTVATIEWTAQSGITYQLQATTNLLVSNGWVNVEAPVVGGAQTNAPAENRKFYRVCAP